MITNDNIQRLYTTYATAPGLFEDRGLTRLMDYAFDTDAIDFDGDRLVFNTIDTDSPLHSIEIERIHGAEEIGRWLAVILPSAIIFLDRTDLRTTRIHLK
ncbi:MAG: hypothetical protein K2H33_02885 [Muribaculaceae bacterium]|nr:hypothetical protein [Muribaculaceae bacterium]MDE6118801.1 hypothetical protein [Muribaculaceae bacterium]MDE6315284.1 hypothetical protein [Muribaculaceae bacterium]